MTFTIKSRVALVIGVLLFLFFATSGVSYILMNRIDDRVTGIARAEDLRRDSVAEMRAQLAEIGRAVLAYAVHRGVPDIGHIRASEAAFERSAAVFLRHAATDEERSLGAQVVGAYDRLKELSALVLAVADREYAELGSVRAELNAIDEALATKIGVPVAGDDPVSRDRSDALLGMSAGVAVGSGALEPLVFGGESDRPETTFGHYAERYRNTGLSAEEEAWLAELSANFAAVAKSPGRIAGLGDRKRELLAALDDQRGRMDELLVGQITPLIARTLSQPDQNAHSLISRAMLYLLVMSGVGIVVGGGAAVLLARRIVNPILDVAAGAAAIGGGELEHRIEIDSEDEIGRLAKSINRMAEDRQQTEMVLREMAHHDALTKLPNRTLFGMRLVEALDYARRIDRMVAIHLLDLDRFKEINDTLGHIAGDMLLQQVSQRLVKCVRKSDTVARLGGDEFAVIQTNLLYQNDISVLAGRLNDALSAPFDLDGESIYTGTSIGITIYPHDGTEADKLLKNADLALYRAKQEGRSTFQLYDPQMNAEIQTRKAMEQDLRQALDHGALFLHYQPQIEIASGRIVGAEALVRWRHPVHGMVPPATFVPVAEQSGLIERLTETVLLDACKQAKSWQEAGLPPLQVSVNLSPADFKRKNVVPMVVATLEESRLDPACLELEITEGMVMSSAESVIATLDQLHALGVELAIDDFGTGFSSMSYLKRFPVDRLKIDQTFVRDIPGNSEDASITNVIINLGHSLGLKVVAEGVESEEQLEFLRNSECDEAQGYCISRPLSASAFAEYFSAHEADRMAYA